MPRDVNGVYTLPAGNPVISGTIIESVWCNTTMEDIANALSDSLSRSGLGSMLAAFRFSDGSEGAPGISWTNEPTSGWWRDALNSFWYSVGGENIFNITKNGVELAPGKTAIGFGTSVLIQDPEPAGQPKGNQWFESDSGAMYLRYQNPDLTYTWIRTNSAGILSQSSVPRITTDISNATPTIDLDTTDVYVLTALAAAAAFQAPTGTYVQSQALLIRIKDNGTPRVLTWDAKFRAVGITLPAITVANKVLYIGAFVNVNDATIDVVGVRQQV